MFIFEQRKLETPSQGTKEDPHDTRARKEGLNAAKIILVLSRLLYEKFQNYNFHN